MANDGVTLKEVKIQVRDFDSFNQDHFLKFQLFFTDFHGCFRFRTFKLIFLVGTCHRTYIRARADTAIYKSHT